MSIEIITGLIGLIGGNLSALLYIPQIRKGKVLENEAKQSEEWRKLYMEEKERREADLKAWEEERSNYDNKIESLYKQISQHRDEKAAMTKANTNLEVENARLRLLKCEVPACALRKPPTGF